MSGARYYTGIFDERSTCDGKCVDETCGWTQNGPYCLCNLFTCRASHGVRIFNAAGDTWHRHDCIDRNADPDEWKCK